VREKVIPDRQAPKCLDAVSGPFRQTVGAVEQETQDAFEIMTKAFKQDLELEFEQIRNLPLNNNPSTTMRSENAEDVALKDLKQTSIATTDPRRQNGRCLYEANYTQPF
jgi:hypothetical protein